MNLKKLWMKSKNLNLNYKNKTLIFKGFIRLMSQDVE
jgi:hypothetical protein